MDWGAGTVWMVFKTIVHEEEMGAISVIWEVHSTAADPHRYDDNHHLQRDRVYISATCIALKT